MKAKKSFLNKDLSKDWHCEIPVFVCSFIQWVADQKAQGMPLHLLPDYCEIFAAARCSRHLKTIIANSSGCQHC